MNDQAPRLHAKCDYGAARFELDELFQDWTVLSNRAEALGFQNADANLRAAEAWNRYEDRRTEALAEEWEWKQPVVFALRQEVVS